jgi:ATP-dependent DNA helicase Q1
MAAAADLYFSAQRYVESANGTNAPHLENLFRAISKRIRKERKTEEEEEEEKEAREFLSLSLSSTSRLVTTQAGASQQLPITLESDNDHNDDDGSDGESTFSQVESAVAKAELEFENEKDELSSSLLQEEKVAADGADPFEAEYSDDGKDDERMAWHVAALRAARESFGVQRLRAPQALALHRLLHTTTTTTQSDVVLVAPTGAGKSLVFQLHALLKGGLTVVVSPLLALVADQVSAAERAGVTAAAFSTALNREEKAAVLARLKAMAEDTPEARRAAQGRLETGAVDNAAAAAAAGAVDVEAGAVAGALRLLYITPEMVAQSKTLAAILEKLHQRGRITLITVDECHCCSQWGYDFRPAYLQLHRLRTLLPGVPLLALTATASAPVVADVQRMLGLRRGTAVLRAPAHRPNLSYSVMRRAGAGVSDRDMEKAAAQIRAWVEARCGLQPGARPPAGIVYVLSRKDTERLAGFLRQVGWRAFPYHAYMDPAQRVEIQSKWANGGCEVVVATVAFGLGINLGNVRFVVHHTIPKGLDAYYQESGRAGRDGQPAHCLLLWQPFDLMRVSSMVCDDAGGVSSVYGVARFAINRDMCRRRILGTHFAEVLPEDACSEEETACDVCSRLRHQRAEDGQAQVNLREDATALAQLVAQLDSLEAWATLRGTAELWKGLKRGNMPPEVAGVGTSRAGVPLPTLEAAIVDLVLTGALRERFRHTPFNTISYIAPGRHHGRLLRGELPVLVDDWQKPKSSSKAKRQAGAASRGGPAAAKRVNVGQP